VAAPRGSDDGGRTAGDSGKVLHQGLRRLPDEVQTGGVAAETQDLVTCGKRTAADAQRTDGRQPAQFAETLGFLAAAEHHFPSCPKNQVARQVTDVKGKSGGVAAGAVFLQQGFEKRVGESIGAHG
jgi:hypothetical protein